MNAEQIKQIKIQMLLKDLTTAKIAEELGARRDIISQLINGHYYYPRYAKEIAARYGIFIPDTRNSRRQLNKAA